MPQGNDDPKVFDVSKPYKTTPSSSSRPIIVGRHPIMADPMVLEERYHHPRPLSPKPAGQPAPQASVALPAPLNSPQRTSITPPSEIQTPDVPLEDKAYTTYGPPQQQLDQPVEQAPPTEASQTSPAPILEMVSQGEATTQKIDTNLPVTPQQPIPENPLHLPAGTASQEHTRNQTGLAIGLFIIIALMALAAVKYFVM